MAYLEWKQEFSVGVPSIDVEHKKLFGMLCELHDAMSVGKGSKIVPDILKRLIAYTQDHFANEEKAMLRAKYPDYAAHKAEHDKLTREVVKMVKEFDDKKLVMSLTMLNFLQNWLTTHILSRDKMYSSSMKTAGLL